MSSSFAPKVGTRKSNRIVRIKKLYEVKETMDFEPQKIPELLSLYRRENQPKECENLMAKLQSLLTEELTESILGKYTVTHCISSR